jgi:hypothetical protein
MFSHVTILRPPACLFLYSVPSIIRMPFYFATITNLAEPFLAAYYKLSIDLAYTKNLFYILTRRKKKPGSHFAQPSHHQ